MHAQTPSLPAAPKVALLGRPNVGKSTLFNRLIRSKRAITHDRPGVTRDRMEGVVKGKDKEPFLIVDTGGVTLDGHARVQEGPEGIRGFEEDILEQARGALAESDLICLVVDGREGLTPLDKHLADYLRKAGKPILLVVNKVDGPEREDILLAEFHGLGFAIIAVSAEHGYRVRELEDEIRDRLYTLPPQEAETALDGLFLEGATRRQQKRIKAAALKEALEGEGEAYFEDDPAAENDPASGGFPAAEAVDAPEDGPHDDEVDRDDGPRDDAEDDRWNADAEPGRDTSSSAPGPDRSPSDEAAEISGGERRNAGDGSGPVSEREPGSERAADDYAGPDLYTGPLRLAMLGRPNAGKSSLVNAMIGSKRMIVSDVAGTTRDSVDVSVDVDGDPVVFVDTAGVRRRAKITDTVERYSVNSSLKSTTKAHVTLLVLDASEGLTQQDKRLIDLLNERKTPFFLLINKSDLIEPRQRKAAEKIYKDALVFCPHVPMLFVSALNRHNLGKIVPLAREIRHECGLRVPTGQLNRAMTSVLERHQPPIVRNVRAKFFYLTQAESLPPTFVFFVNDAERILPSYARYLERSLRKMFGILHAPMRVNFRSSHSKKGKKR